MTRPEIGGVFSTPRGRRYRVLAVGEHVCRVWSEHDQCEEPFFFWVNAVNQGWHYAPPPEPTRRATLFEGYLHSIASRFGNPRIIFDRLGRSKYLSRWYVVGAPTMPDGSDPFLADGTVREDAVWGARKFGLYLHCFHRSDEDTALHNHPWAWAVSLILSGGYHEDRRLDEGTVRRKWIGPGRINVLRDSTFHRVDLLPGREAWSLFFVGPKVDTWFFWDPVTKTTTHWREFINKLRDQVSFARAS